MKLIARDYNPISGFTEEMWYQDPEIQGGPGKVTIRRLQDVDHILAQNKIQHNLHSGKKPSYTDSKGLHKVATVPFGLIEKWHSEGFNWFQSTNAERKAKLNDREYGKLLVRPGKL
jgi:hypothetical protein